MNSRSGELAVLAALAALAGAVFLGVQAAQVPLLRGARGHVLVDPDSYLRWRLVTRAVNGEGVRIRWIDDDNAPFGRTNEWTAPMTIAGATAVRAWQWCGRLPTEEALERASLWVGPAIGLATILVLGWLAWRAGGIKLAGNADEVRTHADNILGMDIKGHLVGRLWIEKASDIAREYYASFTLDRSAKKHLGMLSAQGGVDIEAVAATDPDAIAKIHVDPVEGLTEAQCRAWVAAASSARPATSSTCCPS